jgi:hypothetical protein
MHKAIIQIPLIVRTLLLVSLTVMFTATEVRAQYQITLYQDTGNYSYGDGGEFNAVPDSSLLSVNPTMAGYDPGVTTGLTGNGSGNFQTFCLETSEYFSPGSTYNVAISDSIKYDGGQFLPNGEPLTLGTAWLYSEFAAGTLSGYNYTQGSGRIATAGSLQQAIWYLQGEVGSLVNGSADGTAFFNEAQIALGALDENVTDAANGAYGVAAMNLTDSNNNDAQDQLIIVPEPSSLGLGLLGLLLLCGYKARGLFLATKTLSIPVRAESRLPRA